MLSAENVAVVPSILGSHLERALVQTSSVNDTCENGHLDAGVSNDSSATAPAMISTEPITVVPTTPANHQLPNGTVNGVLGFESGLNGAFENGHLDASVANSKSGKTMVKAEGDFKFGTPRKQRTSLSIQTKLEVIKYAEENPTVTQNKIASFFGIDRTTVSKVLKRKAQYIADENGGGVKRELKQDSPDSPMGIETPKTHLGDMNGLAGVIRNMASRRKGSPSAAAATAAAMATVITTQSPLVKPQQQQRALHSSAKQPVAMAAGAAAAGSLVDYGLVAGLSHEYTLHVQKQLELYDKCESWFMKQQFTTASKKHEKDIIAYSCLISPLPLSMDDCARIIPAKYVKDEAMKWLHHELLNLEAGSKISATNLAAHIDELLDKYLTTESGRLNQQLRALFPDCKPYAADDIRRVWRKYVYPNLKNEPFSEPETTKYHTRAPAAKRTKTSAHSNNNNGFKDAYGQLLTTMPHVTSVDQSPSAFTQPFLLASSASSQFVTSPLLLANHASAVPCMPIVIGEELTGSDCRRIAEDEVLDLSTSCSTQDSAIMDLSSGESRQKVSGSRKRKMNSNPVRITSQEADIELTGAAPGAEIPLTVSNVDGMEDSRKSSSPLVQLPSSPSLQSEDEQNPELVRCLAYSVTSSHAAVNGERRRPRSGAVGGGDHGIIEIIPDDMRDEEGVCQSSDNSALHHNNNNHDDQQEKNCDSSLTDRRLSADNNSMESQQLVATLSENVASLQEQVSQLHEKLREQLREEVATATASCQCRCAVANNNCDAFEKRISTLEDRIDTMQESLTKLLSNNSAPAPEPAEN